MADMNKKMEEIFKEIPLSKEMKEQEKIREYIKQMQYLEGQMDDEYKKILKEIKKIKEVKENMENEDDEEFKKIFNEAKKLNKDLNEAKKLKKDAYDRIVQLKPGLKLLTPDEENKIKKVQDEAKKFKLERRKQWDEYYMKIACLAAQRSKDPRTPVGACIADTKSYQIVGIGYNSMPYVKTRDNDDIFPWKGSEATGTINHKHKYPYVVHAAVNAVLNKTRESIEGCTIYLTHFPDNDCVHAIIKAGITEIVYCMFTRHPVKKRMGDKDMKRAKKLLKKYPAIIITSMEDKEDIVGKNLNEVIKSIKSDERYPPGKEAEWPIGPATNFRTWEEFFMGIALLSKERSTHKYQVGACVVSPKNNVLAVGYNAYPEDMTHDETEDEKQDNKEESEYISHAEYKAIVGISPSVEDCTLYVTKYPCYMCAKVIVQSGVRQVVYDEDGGWREEGYISSRKTLTTCLGAENIKNIRSYDKKLVKKIFKQCQSTCIVKDRVTFCTCKSIIAIIFIIFIIFVLLYYTHMHMCIYKF